MTDRDTEAVNPAEAMHRDFAEQAQREREANASLEGAAWFEATFAGSDTSLLQPLDDTVNYAIAVQYADPYTVELAAEKYWRGENDYLGLESVTLNTYEPEPENENEVAAMDREHLLRVYGKEGLNALMHEAWQTGVECGHLEADDPSLFKQGPPDRFTIQPEYKREWLDPDDTQEIAIPSIAQASTPSERMEVLAADVFDPDGGTLGASTVVVSHAEHELANEGAGHGGKALEIAQFNTKADAEHFRQEFLNFFEYAYPDEMSTLAEEVARGHSLPTAWKDLGQEDVRNIQQGAFSLTHEREDWHPYEYTPDPYYDPDIDR
ncbi:MAG: hypothetical protein HS103_01425 [Anaerolineales bacterium]|nr:hypothetical protein [Anaerolineales bacterium]